MDGNCRAAACIWHMKLLPSGWLCLQTAAFQWFYVLIPGPGYPTCPDSPDQERVCVFHIWWQHLTGTIIICSTYIINMPASWAACWWLKIYVKLLFWCAKVHFSRQHGQAQWLHIGRKMYETYFVYNFMYRFAYLQGKLAPHSIMNSFLVYRILKILIIERGQNSSKYIGNFFEKFNKLFIENRAEILKGF